jgi:50S ribosomal protein L16 3-hydroxylase
MKTHLEIPLLGGLSPQAFMRRHWQKKPLLVRQAVPQGAALLSRAQLLDLAAFEEVESRLIVQHETGWTLRHGPLKRSALPPLKQRQWTLLVQGLNLHVPSAHALLEHFRFVPDARLDDVMISYATDGGGVGPHIDSYDVFLLQTQGQRRWRIGRVARPEWVEGAPLKILSHFEPEHEWLLEAGDMLYLPPGWAHDGVAQGESMTCSIGFRSMGRSEIAREVLQRTLDAEDAADVGALYKDPTQVATSEPGRVPAALQSFAAEAVARLLLKAESLDCALGELLSEPKRGVWFDAPDAVSNVESAAAVAVSLDARSRMLYDDRHVFINGESFRASGKDAKLMRRLADTRQLASKDVDSLSPEARSLLNDWLQAGWLQFN